jgi:hypothetical protein
MGAEVESLKLAFSTNTKWSELATLAVFIGLLGDIFVILLFDLFDEDKTWTEIILAGTASLLIAVGVWGEYRFGDRATEAAKGLQLISEKQIAGLNSDTEKLRHENLKLEAQLAWRTLTKRQRDGLTASMKPFKAQNVDVVSYLGDAEAEELADQIVKCLKVAGIEAGSFKVMELAKLMHGARIETAGPTPVLVRGPFPNSNSVVRQALSPEAKRAADVLDAFMRAEHIATEPIAPMLPRDLERGTWKQITESPVRVMVGIKPR